MTYAYRDAAGSDPRRLPRRYPVAARNATAPIANATGTVRFRSTGRRRSCTTSQALTATTTMTPMTSKRATSPSASVIPFQTNRGTARGAVGATAGPFAAVRQVPDDVCRRGNCGRRRRHSPPSSHERDEGHGEEHRERDPRAHHRDRHERRRDRVPTDERTRLRHHQDRRQAERNRGDERDLPGVREVLEAGAEHRKDGDEAQRDPRVDLGSNHHVPQEDDGREVHDDDERDVRHVRVETDERVEGAEREDGHRRPVLVVRLEESHVPWSCREPTVDQDEPLVSTEPLVSVDVHEHEGSEADDNPQRARRGAIRSNAMRRKWCVGGVVLARLGDVQAWSSFVASTRYCFPRIFHASG